MLPEGHSKYAHDHKNFMFAGVLAVACIIISNTFILTVVIWNWKSIRKQCRNRSSLLLTTALCVTDAILGFTSIYYFCALYTNVMVTYLRHSESLCITTIFLRYIVHYASGFVLIAIAVDRYIYVVHALRYARLMTTRRVLAMICATWIAAILVATPIYYLNQWTDGVVACEDIYVIPVTYVTTVSITRSSLVIITIALFHWKIHRAAVNSRNNNEPLSFWTSLRRKSARVVLIIFCVYMVTWTPYLIVRASIKFGVDVPPIVYSVTRRFVYIHYIVNPFVYAIHNRAIKEAITRTLNCLTGGVCFRTKKHDIEKPTVIRDLSY